MSSVPMLLAIKIHGRLQYLIEVKLLVVAEDIGQHVADDHTDVSDSLTSRRFADSKVAEGASNRELGRDLLEYGSREGIEWILLTNGHLWQAHRIRFEQPIDHDLVFEVDLLSDSKLADLLEKLYLVSREAGNATVIDLYWQSKEATSRYVLAQLLLSDPALHVIRRQLRSLFKGTKITPEELAVVLQTEVLKREVLEGDKAVAAAKTVKRAVRRRRRAMKDNDTGADILEAASEIALPPVSA